ncbi:MAG: hypothetical protein H6Q89_3346 [Myxococcaceae bacterium]|nr:hypothetical protein [Myxococcaceae bacterium]
MIWLSLLLAANGPNPAYVTPGPIWGELKPSDVVTIAPSRDHSAFDEATQAFSGARLTVAVEPWSGALLEATNTGFAVWDLATSPKNPPRIGSFSSTGFPKLPAGEAAKHFVRELAAPPAGSSLAALALSGGAGVALVNLTNKAAPEVLYQDGDPLDPNTRSCQDAYSASLGGKGYALVACNGGVSIYDLTAAALIPAVYQEVTPNPGSSFPTVFVGAGKLVSTWMDTGVAKQKSVTRLDGVEQYVVTNAALGGGFDVWDVSAPASPLRLGGGAGVDFIGAVAMWKVSDRYFVAALTPTQLQFYEVTRVVKGTSTDAGAVLAWLPAVRAYEADTRLQLSRAADGSPILSYASGREPPHDGTSVGLLEEHLLDVTDPTAPREITPVSGLVNGVQTSYWGYGYQFGWARALGGRFAGAFFYRALFGALEIHQWTPPLNRPPQITSTPPTTATVNRAYHYPIAATDPEGKPLTWVKTTGPAAMEFLAPGELSWVPAATDLGDHPVTITVSDGKNFVVHNWTIAVAGPSPDAGTGDGGTLADGGTLPVTPPRGCGCQSGTSPLAACALLLLLGRRRRSVGE